EKETADGVLVQFGGQTAINLASPLQKAGVRILGSQVDAIDKAEDRERFAQLLLELGIPQSEGCAATSVSQARAIAEELGFPVLVRPSYVIGGRAMQVVENFAELESYLTQAITLSPEHPILVDRYLEGKEVEVDAVADGEITVIPGIMEHIERAGVHSGDSLAVYPTQSLTPAEIQQIQDYTCRIAKGMEVRGLLNIQFVVVNGKVYVIEVNPRASRTVPILSKVTGIPLVALAVRVAMGEKLADLGYAHGLAPEIPFVVVKAPVFSFEKLTQVETSLGPEMKSTGEVLGMDVNFGHALAKAFAASHVPLPDKGDILVAVAEKDRPEAIAMTRELSRLGFGVKATGNTAKALLFCGVPLEEVREASTELKEAVRRQEFSFVLSTPSKGDSEERTGYLLRRLAAEHRVPCLTSMDTAQAVVRALKEIRNHTAPQTLPLQAYLAMKRSTVERSTPIPNA
ncbi:MAG: ATP-grasp domain-containing protein, partial [Desulfitobacterium hafniense]